jgi:hypothetical protein
VDGDRGLAEAGGLVLHPLPTRFRRRLRAIQERIVADEAERNALLVLFLETLDLDPQRTTLVSVDLDAGAIGYRVAPDDEDEPDADEVA